MYFDEHGKGTAQKGIYLGKLAECPISVPPLAEQHRIVAKVDELMELCDQLEASLTHTAATRRRLLDMATSEKTRVHFYHAPFPSNGFIAKDGNGFQLVPAQWTPSI